MFIAEELLRKFENADKLVHGSLLPVNGYGKPSLSVVGGSHLFNLSELLSEVQHSPVDFFDNLSTIISGNIAKVTQLERSFSLITA